MFANAQPAQFFPTTVWIYDLPEAVAKPLNERLYKTVDAMFTPRPALAPGQSWQTKQDLHLREEFEELVGYMLETGRQTLDKLEAIHEGVEITGCWANLSGPGGGHRPHHHANNYLSGVYYVRAPEGARHIAFHEPRFQNLIVQPRFKRYNAFNAAEITVEVPEGRFVLFPSWLTHSVPVHKGEAERLSISYNLMFSDFANAIAKPMWQGRAG